MTGSDPEIPRALKRGLKGLRLVKGCEPVENIRFEPTTRRWVMSLWLYIDTPGEYVPSRTKWCLVVEENYPGGSIKLFPAAVDGLVHSFPHQSRNHLEFQHQGWRSGKLCLDSPFRGERGLALIRDPFGDSDQRLRWHIERALAWLAAAATGQLLAPGDPFETPDRPTVTTRKPPFRCIVHDESESTFQAWSGCTGGYGRVEFKDLPGLPKYLVASFCSLQGNPIHPWQGRAGEPAKPAISGLWWLWPGPVVVPPWHSPGTWGELRKAGEAAGVDVDSFLVKIAQDLRNRDTETILMLGYPIPTYVGKPPQEIHWDAVMLPRLPKTSTKPPKGLTRLGRQNWRPPRPPKGFRANPQGWWQRDRNSAFKEKGGLTILQVENWSADRLQARGRFTPPLLDARVAVIGAGALGSLVAELLVRAGLNIITLIDGDFVEKGNVCRHLATLNDVYRPKVEVVAQRLEQISPIVKVSTIGDRLPEDPNGLTKILEPFDLLIDCTASDVALSSLAGGWWPIPRLFVSFSLGFKAQRLFSFGISGHQFPNQDFNRLLAPWLEEETSAWAESGELLEGSGCWSPLFPARYDDVVMAASFCIKELERMVSNRPRNPELRVFQQAKTGEGICSFALLEESGRPAL